MCDKFKYKVSIKLLLHTKFKQTFTFQNFIKILENLHGKTIENLCQANLLKKSLKATLSKLRNN